MKGLPAATGVCVWLDDAPNGNRQLEITVDGTSHIYEVAQEGNEWKLLRVDFRTGEIKVYKVKCLQRNLWQCNCPDAQYRRRYTCKHARALPAALSKLPF